MYNKTGFKFLLVVIAGVMFWSNTIFAGGILVDPSVIKVSSVTLGKDFELKTSTGVKEYFLSITNTDNKPSKYTVEVLTCKEYGCTPYFGYSDIPDVKWIEIKSPGILVPAKETGYVRDVFIKIPKKKKYYNQRWQAIVKVLKKASAGEMMNLEVILPLWIETERKVVKAKSK